ncbi:MAG: hypothetical protein ACK56I_09255, partial [bacterium]
QRTGAKGWNCSWVGQQAQGPTPGGLQPARRTGGVRGHVRDLEDTDDGKGSAGREAGCLHSPEPC